MLGVGLVLAILITDLLFNILDDNHSEWKKGGKLKLSEAASLFDDSKRKHLKAECGGLQTLLRNFNQVHN